MAFKENFELDETDIELIEDTVRNEIRLLTGKKINLPESESDSAAEMDITIKRLNMLLGKLHNQKVWYAQVKQSGFPSG